MRYGREVLSNGGRHFAAEVGLAQALDCHPEGGGEEPRVGSLHISNELGWESCDLRVYDTEHLCNLGFGIHFLDIIGVRSLQMLADRLQSCHLGPAVGSG